MIGTGLRTATVRSLVVHDHGALQSLRLGARVDRTVFARYDPKLPEVF